MLESWALREAPTLDPGVAHEALRLAPHPLGFKDFEGTIPRGEYGAGTLLIWDRGRFRHRGGTDERGTYTVAQALADGRIEFELRGARLRGWFRLERTGVSMDAPGRERWTVLRVSEERATTDEPTPSSATSAASASRSIVSGRTIEQIEADSTRI